MFKGQRSKVNVYQRWSDSRSARSLSSPAAKSTKTTLKRWQSEHDTRRFRVCRKSGRRARQESRGLGVYRLYTCMIGMMNTQSPRTVLARPNPFSILAFCLADAAAMTPSPQRLCHPLLFLSMIPPTPWPITVWRAIGPCGSHLHVLVLRLVRRLGLLRKQSRCLSAMHGETQA